MSIRKVVYTVCFFIASLASAQCNYSTPISYNYNCIPQYPSIARVMLNTLDNSTSCSGSYADYTSDASLRPKVYRGTLDTIFVQANYYAGNNTDQYMAAFIDWNNNNALDTLEYLDLGYIYGSNGYPTRTIFKVPTNVALGTVRMRVRSCYFNESITYQDLCKTFNFGETEDYLITIADTTMSVSYTAMQPVLSYSSVVQGSTNVPALRIDVTADGILSPKFLDDLYFHFPNTVKKENFSAAKVYYTAEADTFNTLNLISTISNPATNFSFTGLNRELSGGVQYYWLAFDVKASSSIDELIDAISDSAAVSGLILKPFQNDPYGTVSIDLCKTSSSQSCNYYLKFVSLPGVEFYEGCVGGYYKYPYGGSLLEAGTYYGKVEVSDTSEVAVMLDYNDDGDFLDDKEFLKFNVLPGAEYQFDIQVPDSVAGLFRARLFAASSITSPADACTAENVYDLDIYGYPSEPMEFYGANAGGLNRKLAQAGETSVAVLQVGVETLNSGTPLVMNALRFTTSGTTDTTAITNAKLWFTKGISEFNIGEAVLLSSLSSISQEFTLSSTQELYPGMNYFWLTYDVKANAPEGSKIDASCDGIVVGDQDYYVGNGDPSGYIQVGDTMWMKSASISQCRTILYDDGGPSGNYSSNSYTLTLATIPGRYFEVRIRKFDLAEAEDAPDWLTFYEGASPNPNSVIGEFSKNNPPESPGFTTLDSVLTIQFTKGNSLTAQGWELEIFCKYNCSSHPIAINYNLEQPACEGAIQRLTTELGGEYKKPLTYTLSAYGDAFNFDSVKVVKSSDAFVDTTYYLYSQYLDYQTYYLMVEDSNECTTATYVYPGSEVYSPININATTTESCPNDSSGSVTLNPQTTGVTTFKWTGKLNSTAQNLPSAPPGFYSVHVEDESGCKDTSFVVYANPYSIETPGKISGPSELGPNPGTQRYNLPALPIIKDGGNEEARTTPLLSDYTYQFTLSPSSAGNFTLDSAGALIKWSESFGGEAKLYVRYQHIETGCYSFYSLPYVVSIESVPEVIVPEEAEAAEGFSPNGDGKNDFFVIRNLTTEGNTLFVYNREGVVIYERANYKNDWDGTLNGDGKKAVADGVYFWVLENDEGIPTFKGFLELRR